MAVRNTMVVSRKCNPFAADLAAAGSQLYPQSPPLFNTHVPHPPPGDKTMFPRGGVVSQGLTPRYCRLPLASSISPLRHGSETLETCATQSYSEANIGYGVRYDRSRAGFLDANSDRTRTFSWITPFSESTEAYQYAWQSLQSLTGTR